MTAQEYQKTHDLDVKFTEKMGCVWTDECLTIPVYSQNKERLYEKIRYFVPNKPKFYTPPGTDLSPYPLWKHTNQQDIYLCEGEVDAIRLWQDNIPAITFGGVTNLKKKFKPFFTNKTVHLALDNDDTGQDNLDKYIEFLKDAGATIQIVEFPPAIKDVCEFFAANQTKGDFLSLPSLTLDEYELKRLSARYEVISNKDFLSVIRTPNQWLVNGLIRTPGITLVVGEGGVGKTAVVHSIVKAVSDGTYWLDQFKATPSRVLILDKENEEIDIQNNFLAQDITSPNIFHYNAKTLMFWNEKGEMSKEARFLQLMAQKEQIDVVVFDSLIDFFEGSEIDSVAVAKNFLIWREVFPNAALILIHHERKPENSKLKQAAKHRIKGNTHFYNGSQSILSVSIPDDEDNTVLLIEHTKVRGAKLQKPFTIEMKVSDHPTIDGQTVIAGFTYIGEVKLESAGARAAQLGIVDLLNKFPDTWFSAEMIREELSDGITPRDINVQLKKLVDSGSIKKDTKKIPGLVRGFCYTSNKNKDGDNSSEIYE